mmetsp:Transcript_39299/g.50764  ORF Transcript_39299/g.50764 Transcript_39299/m.50764 type:complete len:264 (+) Transcript_39299:162-953(+)
MKLETTDPEKMEAIQRVRSLTSQLVDVMSATTKADEKINKRKILCAKVQATLIRNGQATRTNNANPSASLALTDGGSVTEQQGGGGGGLNGNNETSIVSNSTNGGEKVGSQGGQNKESLVGDFTLISSDSAHTPMANRVQQFGALLKERNARLNALSTELDMYQQQVTSDADELANIEKEYKQLKKAWFADCRRRSARQIQANEEAHDNGNLSELLAGGNVPGGFNGSFGGGSGGGPDSPYKGGSTNKAGSKVTIPSTVFSGI